MHSSPNSIMNLIYICFVIPGQDERTCILKYSLNAATDSEEFFYHSPTVDSLATCRF
jgi:hypothetical protein